MHGALYLCYFTQKLDNGTSVHQVSGNLQVRKIHFDVQHHSSGSLQKNKTNLEKCTCPSKIRLKLEQKEQTKMSFSLQVYSFDLVTALDISLMSRIEGKYCLIRTSSLAGLFDIFILIHHWQNCVLLTFYHWGHFVMLIIRNLNLISVQSWTYLRYME